MFQFSIFIVLLYHSIDAVVCASQSEIDRHLELGRDFLAKGQLQDALKSYHAAVDADPKDYLTYYKRGTVYLALGKAKLALADLDKVLNLKPDFTSARVRRGTILFKQAEFDRAKVDILDVLAADANNEEASELHATIDTTQNFLSQAQSFMEQKKYEEAIEYLTEVIDACPWAAHVRELRAEANVALGYFMNAVSDIRMTTKLLSDNTEGLFKLASMLYLNGQVLESFEEIRNCLKLDPDHKKCFPYYKNLKKIAKKLKEATEAEESRDTATCVAASKQILAYEKEVDNVRFLAHHLLCKCLRNDPDPGLAVSSCQEALNVRREPNILCDSAEAYLAAEMYDDAIREVKAALEMSESFQRAKELLQKAQQQQKMSETRDYYKILQVPRSATKKEIIKAYRKEAQKWHPDNFHKDVEKKRAQKKFIDIAAAKEVLTDESKRARFDNGEDPLDPESGSPKAPHFRDFHDFHGSPFQFKFHYN